jgi:hypothetical protein
MLLFSASTPKQLLFALLALLIKSSCMAQPQGSNIITITPDMVVQLTSGDNNAVALFDGDLSTAWFPGWSGTHYPARCRVDLGRQVFIDSIRVFDGNGQPDFYIFYANDLSETPKYIKRTVLVDFMRWQAYPVFKELRYLYFTLVHPFGDAQVLEIAVSEGDTSVVPIDTFVPRGDVDKFNLCGFHWIPIDKLQPYRSLRMYVPSGWFWRPNGLFIEPLFQAQTQNVSGYDTYLAAAKAANIRILPAINQTPDWYAGVSVGVGSNDYPPVLPGLSRTDPASYRDFAEILWQFTARYGRVPYPDSRLRVDTTARWPGDPPNVRRSALDLIEEIEVWNEPDKWWVLNGPDSGIYFQPEEYAAMLSICYDSIKSADPSVRVIMAGLAGMDLAYLNRMKNWFIANRPDGKFPADAINVHHYSNLATQNGPPWAFFNAGGMCPEMDVNFGTIAQVIQFAQDMDLETWVTEFGYDTNLPSWQHPAPIPGYTAYELQAQWLLRSYLEYLRFGVDNLFMYNGIDEPNAAVGGLYQSSGLMYGGGGNPPFSDKLSNVKMKQLVGWLSGTVLDSDKSLQSPNVRILSFQDSNGKEKLIYWRPTMSGPNASTTFSLPGTPTLTATEWPQLYEVN